VGKPRKRWLDNVENVMKKRVLETRENWLVVKMPGN
jgi:hypothetical protein